MISKFFQIGYFAFKYKNKKSFRLKLPKAVPLSLKTSYWKISWLRTISLSMTESKAHSTRTVCPLSKRRNRCTFVVHTNNDDGEGDDSTSVERPTDVQQTSNQRTSDRCLANVRQAYNRRWMSYGHPSIRRLLLLLEDLLRKAPFNA